MSKKGFLLLEVMVSVVVITVGLVYIVRSFSSSTRAIGVSRRYLKAVSLMEQRLWEIDWEGQIESGDDYDAFEDDPEFEWRLEAKTEDEIPINKTELMVTWKDRNRTQTLTIETYLWNKED